MSPTPSKCWRRWWPVALAAGLGSLLAFAPISRLVGREPVYQGQPLSAWLERFDSADRATHAQVLGALRALGPAAMARLNQDLLRPDPLFAALLRPVLARFRSLKFNIDGAENRRIHTVKVLDELGPQAGGAVPALLRTVYDPRRRVPPAIVQRALLDIGPASAPLLIEALGDEREAVRHFANLTLFALVEDRGVGEPLERAAVAPLVKGLRDQDPEERALAAATLGRLGPRARPAAAALIPALHDRAADVRARVAAALGEIDANPNTAVPPLTDALADGDAVVREAAAIALGRFGHAARSAAAALALALTDPNESVRVNSANAVGRLGVADPPIVAALVPRLRDPAPLVRASGAAALGKLGPPAANAVAALIQALQDPDPQVRGSAATALGRLGPAALPAVPALADALRDDQNSVRICAIQALGGLGPPAAGAIPALLKAQLNDFAGIGRYVADALNNIHPETTANRVMTTSGGE